MIRRPPRSTLFPYTRSSDLLTRCLVRCRGQSACVTPTSTWTIICGSLGLSAKDQGSRRTSALLDRKSTRLNSSHGYISYAVFCLKKKNETHDTRSSRVHNTG